MRGTKTETYKGSGIWRLRVFVGRRVNGTPIQERKTFRGASKLADAALAKFVLEVEKRSTEADRAETVSELVDQWLTHCESLGRSPNTLKKYRQIIEAVVRPELGHVRLAKLTSRDLDRLYAKLTKKGNKATTVRRVHALIGAALHQARKWSYVERNVSEDATPPPVHAAQVEAPSPAEVQALVLEVEKRDPTLARLVLLDALTGLRRAEIAALRWTDVDLDNKRLTVSRSIYETSVGVWAEKPTKTHQVRTIALNDLALATLYRERDAIDQLAAKLDLEVLTDGFIFSKSPVGAAPYRLDVLTKGTKAAADKIGIDTHFHALRHFFVTQALAATDDVVTVSDQAGHADPSVTLKVYGHVLEQRKRDMADAMGKVFELPPAVT